MRKPLTLTYPSAARNTFVVERGKKSFLVEQETQGNRYWFVVGHSVAVQDERLTYRYSALTALLEVLEEIA